VPGAPAPKKPKVAVPATPLKKGQALVKVMHKYMCNLQGMQIQMNLMRHQSLLQDKLRDHVALIQQTYNRGGKLAQTGCNEQPTWDALAADYLAIKESCKDDVNEAASVVASTARPAKGTMPSAKKGAKGGLAVKSE
jgi:hypothetical protein